LQEKKLKHQPPEPKFSPITLATDKINEVYKDALAFLTVVCHYAAVELSSQPFIRRQYKDTFRKQGLITVHLTEQGKKELDIFHPSYRVKLVNNKPLSELKDTDLFFDIQ